MKNCSEIFILTILDFIFQCSKPCGQRGVQILEQKCLGEETNQHHDLSSCGISDEENTNKITRACFNSCQDNKGKYLWHVGKWTEVCRT